MSTASSRAADALFGTESELGPVAAGAFHGEWRNTKPDTSGIRSLAIAPADGGLTIRVRGAGGERVVDWGTRPAEAYACIEENGVRTAALRADYDFDFMTSTLQLRLNKGILALMSFNVFTDGSGRSSYYAREFFFHAGDVGKRW